MNFYDWWFKEANLAEEYKAAAYEAFDAGAASQAMVIAAKDAEIAELVSALERLARLGNGDQYGNSEGNRIAQAALAKVRKP